MKVFQFPSRTVAGLNYVMSEEGQFMGAFNEEPPILPLECEVVSLTQEQVTDSKELRTALMKNRVRHGNPPKIFVFGNRPDTEPGLYFALAESGFTLAVAQAKNSNRASWELGLKQRCGHTASYEKHYPEGFELEYVSHDQLPHHFGLIKARLLNQLICDVRGADNEDR